MATQLLQVYKCGLCGNTIEVIGPNAGTLTCCNQAMGLMDEQTADSSTEKHVPVVEEVACNCTADCCGGGKCYKVTVGSTIHPMTEEHSILWIELIADGKGYRQFLKPGSEPVATFCCIEGETVSAREECNLHGLWKS